MQKPPGSKTLIKDPSSEIIILREREREREREVGYATNAEHNSF